MSKILLTDIDDTVLQWRSEFERYVRDHLKMTTKPWLHSKHELHEWLEIDTVKTNALLHDFNQSEHFAMLEPCAHSREAIERLAKEGWKFIGITSCSNNSMVAKARRKNIKEHFGDAFSGVHCIAPGESKKPLLEAFYPTFWVEDNVRWAKLGADLGHTTFLLNQEHNQSFTDDKVLRVNDWREIAAQILEA